MKSTINTDKTITVTMTFAELNYVSGALDIVKNDQDREWENSDDFDEGDEEDENEEDYRDPGLGEIQETFDNLWGEAKDAGCAVNDDDEDDDDEDGDDN